MEDIDSYAVGDFILAKSQDMQIMRRLIRQGMN